VRKRSAAAQPSGRCAPPAHFSHSAHPFPRYRPPARHSQAQGTASALSKQRALFDSMTSKVALLGTRFPALNSVLGAVRRKRSKDTLILSSVVAVCLVLILLYRFATK
jgi:hypothetical protein